jgi:hypothetical protein
MLSDAALANAFIFLSLGMDLFRSILLWTRARHARLAAAVPAAAAVVREESPTAAADPGVRHRHPVLLGRTAVPDARKVRDGTGS